MTMLQGFESAAENCVAYAEGDDRPARIAADFAAVLRRWLTPGEFAELRRLNGTPAYAGGCCASHDYCDANVAMAGAFATVVGHQVEASSEADAALWNDAWEIARELHIGPMPDSSRSSRCDCGNPSFVITYHRKGEPGAKSSKEHWTCDDCGKIACVS
jgi:hypothetical protein